MTKISNNFLLEQLQSKFGDKILSYDEPHGMLTVVADPSINIEILEFLFQEPQLQYQFLTDVCGIHYPDQDLPLGVVYHLHSLANNHRVRFKFFLPDHNPHIRTASQLHAGANWMERETFDFYGIIFDGHPNLKRILNVDEMEVFPLRKEFPLEDPNRIDKQDKFFGR
ncbi:MAG TPA: NADH-quinone oxidoreductase subunit C [Cytophagales bacterium]|mgnify:CR=1 FL=1|nr:NADH-quinone oxidoreductase subunit C [Cytophagales bacterium]